MEEKIFKVGNLEFRFGPPLENIGDEEIICDTRGCPYENVCWNIPDPEALEDKSLCFVDFCGMIGIGENGDPEDHNRMPLSGSLEEGFKDYPEILKILEENKKVD